MTLEGSSFGGGDDDRRKIITCDDDRVSRNIIIGCLGRWLKDLRRM